MAWSSKQYARINWRNRPSTATALGATNLNKMDAFLNEVDNELIELEARKLNISTANGMIASLSIDIKSGIVVATQLDGTKYSWDLNVEKIPVSFSLSEDGILTMVTDDGTVFDANIAEMIKDYVFNDSDTIVFGKEFNTSESDTKGSYHVTAEVREGSIEEKHLNPDYRSDIQDYSNKAQEAANESLQYARDSKSYAVGTDGEVRPNDEEDNSKFYSELAKKLTEESQKLLEQAQKIISAASSGALIPSGTIEFSELPENPQIGYMYNISDAFVTDERFSEGIGIFYQSGANVYWTKDGQWDVMVGAQVTGVKGGAESTYRIGNVNLTPENIGAISSNGDASLATVTFQQASDLANIQSGDTLSVAFSKLSKFCSEFGTAAYCDVADNLSTTSSGSVLAARQGKILDDKITEVNDNIPTKYAGSASAGGSATSAVKLDTAVAGSATQPCYFSEGRPMACAYTLAKSVPANAVFTDTNTWRGVQDNLTSSATDQSLSANMGRVLHDKVKGVKDSGINFFSGVSVTGVGQWGLGNRGNNQLMKLYGSGLCIGFVQITFNSVYAEGSVIGTFPSGFYPMYGIGFLTPTFEGRMYNIDISNAGVRTYTRSAVGDSVVFSFTYISNPE